MREGELSAPDGECQAYVVVATRGRPAETGRLLEYLSAQTLRPARVVLVGAGATDLPQTPSPDRLDVLALISPRPGATSQRNVGLERLFEDAELAAGGRAFVVFFDDDFRPADDWLETAAAAFRGDAALAGLTGHVLADGVRDPRGLSEGEAQEFLAGRMPARPHWSDSRAPKSVESLYGCNMAVTGEVARTCRFDEALPLYGWQEDCDFTGQVRRLGDTRIEPACRGVHLGVKGGRSSGLRLGYSQIANPLWIARRRNMTWFRALRFVGHALLANLVRSLTRNQTADYRGRLRGNTKAMFDLLLLRCRPDRILDLQG